MNVQARFRSSELNGGGLGLQCYKHLAPNGVKTGVISYRLCNPAVCILTALNGRRIGENYITQVKS